jgi:hypothetical protein
LLEPILKVDDVFFQFEQTQPATQVDTSHPSIDPAMDAMDEKKRPGDCRVVFGVGGP